MAPRRSAKLHQINMLIGAVLTVAGLAGGFLLTFWFLIVLLPITCVAASWMMAWTAFRAREAHTVAALFLTVLLLAWFAYFLQNGAEMPTWYGIFLMWSVLMFQAVAYLASNPRETDSADLPG